MSYGQPITSTIPTVSATVGPTYASDINDLLQEVIDCLEAKVTEAGILIGGALNTHGYALTEAGAVYFDNLANAPAGSALLYVLNDELYFGNGGGTHHALTSGGAVNTAGVGDFGGDFGGANPAFVGFNDAGDKYYFNEDTNLFAYLESGGLKIRRRDESAPNTITIESPASLVASINRTLVGAYPAGQAVITMSTAGTETTSTNLASFALTPASVAATSYLSTAEADTRHGERTIVVNGSELQVNDITLGHTKSSLGLLATANSVGGTYSIPIPVGSRIKSVAARVIDTNGVGGALTLVLNEITIATGASVQIGSTQTSAADGTEQPLTIGSLTTTAAAGVAYVVSVGFPTTVGAGSPRLRGLSIVYDRVA